MQKDFHPSRLSETSRCRSRNCSMPSRSSFSVLTCVRSSSNIACMTIMIAMMRWRKRELQISKSRTISMFEDQWCVEHTLFRCAREKREEPTCLSLINNRWSRSWDRGALRQLCPSICNPAALSPVLSCPMVGQTVCAINSRNAIRPAVRESSRFDKDSAFVVPKFNFPVNRSCRKGGGQDT